MQAAHEGFLSWNVPSDSFLLGPKLRTPPFTMTSTDTLSICTYVCTFICAYWCKWHTENAPCTYWLPPRSQQVSKGIADHIRTPNRPNQRSVDRGTHTLTSWGSPCSARHAWGMGRRSTSHGHRHWQVRMLAIHTHSKGVNIQLKQSSIVHNPFTNRILSTKSAMSFIVYRHNENDPHWSM